MQHEQAFVLPIKTKAKIIPVVVKYNSLDYRVHHFHPFCSEFHFLRSL